MTTKYEVAFLVGFLMAVAFLIYYYFAHRNLDKDYSKLVKKYDDLEKDLLSARNELSKFKKTSKHSDSSKLDATLSEINDLKSRLQIAEATARDATEKSKLSNNVREERRYYYDKYRQLDEENEKLKAEIKKIKQTKPRPQHVYSSLEVEDQVLKYKNKLDKKDEEIKSLKYQLSDTSLKLEQTQEDLQDLLDTVDSLNEDIRFLNYAAKNPDEYTSLIKDAVHRVASLPFAELPADFETSISNGKLNNAFKSHLMIIDKINMEAKIKSDNGTYTTTLHSCTCPDFTYRHNVCKHMLFLSYTSGLLLLNKEVIESCK